MAPGVVLIDEVDAHLHPTWQRRIGLWFREHFPKLQFIVSTHSPLICQAATVGKNLTDLVKALKRMGHPTVWQEIKRQHHLIPELDDSSARLLKRRVGDEQASQRRRFSSTCRHPCSSVSIRGQVCRLELREHIAVQESGRNHTKPVFRYFRHEATIRAYAKIRTRAAG